MWTCRVSRSSSAPQSISDCGKTEVSEEVESSTLFHKTLNKLAGIVARQWTAEQVTLTLSAPSFHNTFELAVRFDTLCRSTHAD